MLEKLKHPVVILLLKFAVLYICWFLFYDVWMRGSGLNETRAIPTSKLDSWVILRTTQSAAGVLTGLGYDVFYDGYRTLGIKGVSGLWVGDACNAITLVALFSGIIIVFGGIWWHKIIYIFIGGMSIWLLNVIRLVVLAILNLKSKAIVDFNHSYTFTIIIYAWIIFLWYWWIKKYSEKKKVSHEN